MILATCSHPLAKYLFALPDETCQSMLNLHVSEWGLCWNSPAPHQSQSHQHLLGVGLALCGLRLFEGQDLLFFTHRASNLVQQAPRR